MLFLLHGQLGSNVLSAMLIVKEFLTLVGLAINLKLKGFSAIPCGRLLVVLGSVKC